MEPTLSIFHCTAENNALKQQAVLLKAEVLELSEQLTTVELKSKGLKEYLTSRGDVLQNRLFESERRVMENKQLKAEAENRLVRAEERHREEREEWMARKEQMEEVIKSLNSQVEVNLDRAKAALVSDP